MRVFIFFIAVFVEVALSASLAECPSSIALPQVREKVSPYLLPEDHPIKERLDAIVSSSTTSVFSNMETMSEAGFERVNPQPHTKLIVTRHPQLKGYIIKAYLDDQAYFHGKPEHYYWVKRVKGANLLRDAISRNGYGHLMKVPQKWIYALPDKPTLAATSKPLRKLFILVEEEMDILNDEENDKRWGSALVTKELLDALYKVISRYRFKDCAKPGNCPFCKDGRVAFIDTQSFRKKSVSYYKLNDYLNPAMKAYWLKLTETRSMPWLTIATQTSATRLLSKFQKMLSGA